MKSPIYWITEWKNGCLGTMARPRGGDWLEDEIQCWIEADVEIVVSALTDDEIVELSLEQEHKLCTGMGLHFFRYPIQDRGVPTSLEDWTAFIQKIGSFMTSDSKIVAHCRMGIGRASLIAVSLMILSGVSPKQAFEWVEKARGYQVPDTIAQRDWIGKFAVCLQ